MNIKAILKALFEVIVWGASFVAPKLVEKAYPNLLLSDKSLRLISVGEEFMKSNCFIHLEQNLLESVVREVESAYGKIGHLTTKISIVSFRFPILHSLPHLTNPYQHENAIDE